MTKLQKISESEMEIMKVIWNQEKPLTSGEISKLLSLQKKWAASTVLTFLSRLCDKGILQAEKKGLSNRYTALVTENQYKVFETECFFKTVHRGNPKSYLSALIESEDLSSEDIQELKKWFSEL